MVAFITCHCRNHAMVVMWMMMMMMMVVVVMMMMVVASPKQALNRSPDLSRGPFRAAVRAEREYGGNENLPGARLGLVLDGFAS
eukprot:15432321-Alexandrium_andersonii.AAC.1